MKETASQLITLQYTWTHLQLPAACSTVVLLFSIRLLSWISVYIQQIHHLCFMQNLVFVFLRRIKKQKVIIF